MGKNKISVTGDKALMRRLNKLKNTQKVKQVVKASGSELEAVARTKAPVDTGYLRRGIIMNQAGPMTVVVKSTAEYSGFLEYGTRYMRAQPYMRPAVEQVKPKFQEQLKKAVEDSR